MGLPNISLTQLFDRCIDNHVLICSEDERFLAYGRENVLPSGYPITVSLDSTGISINKYGGWLVNKLGLKKITGWIEPHVAVNTATNEILPFVITMNTVAITPARTCSWSRFLQGGIRSLDFWWMLHMIPR